MRSLVFNGWAAGPETWALCEFPHDWVFNYVEQLDGLPEKVIDEFDEVILVGFSMGGSTALRMLLRNPEKVKGLVLVSATPRMMEERKEQGTRNGERVEVEWKGMSLRRRAALKLGTQLVYRNDPSPLFEEHNLDRGLDYLQNTDLRADLLSFSRSPFPVSIFQSERDGIVCPNNADFLKGIFPQARVTMVPGSEHVLPVLVPNLIDAAVFDIIEGNAEET